MEKNKNRTDLLAAGRKKLQQFRQKKDNKGSIHGKSSHKSSKPEHEIDAALATDAVKSMVPSEAADMEGTSRLDADVGSDDLALSNSLVKSVAPDSEVSAVDMSVPPVVVDSGTGEAGKPGNVNFGSNDSENREVGLILSTEIGCYSSVPVVIGSVTDGERIRSADVEATEVDSLGPSSKAMVVEGEAVHDSLEPLQFFSSDSTVDATEGNSTVHMEGPKIEEEELMHVQQDLLNLTSSEIKEDQEGDSLGSKQWNGSIGESHGLYDENQGVEFVRVELEKDGGLVSPKHIGNSELHAGVDSERMDTKEAVQGDAETIEVEGISMSDDAGHELGGSYEVDALSVSEGVEKKEDETSAVYLEVVPDLQSETVGARSSREKHLDIPLLSHDFGMGWKKEIQAANEQNMAPNEKYKQKYSPEGYVAVERSLDNPLEIKSESLSSGRIVYLGADLGMVDLSQLAEVLKRLNEEEVSFVLMSRESAPKEEFGTVGSLFVPKYSFLDVFNDLKEKLYSTFVEKEFIHLQLMEQNELHMEFDRRDIFLVNEVSKLCALLQETQERNANLSEGLAQCRSELQDVSTDRDELQHQIVAARGEIEECCSRAGDLHIQLERSHEELTNLSAELVDCKDLLASLQKENANLSANLLLVTEERKKLEEEKDYFVHKNEKLSAELVEHCEQLSSEWGKHTKLEFELKDAISHLEKLTEENIFLSSSLDIHKAKVNEIDNRYIQLSAQSWDAANQIGYADTPRMICDNSSVYEVSSPTPVKNNAEIFPAAEGQLSLQVLGDACDDNVGFVGFERHLEEAEKVLRKLEKAIEGMHSNAASLSRSGSKVAASGISKLIQAFETKVHHDENESEGVILTEEGPEQLAGDQFKFAKDQTANLRALLKEIGKGGEKAYELLNKEHANRELADVTLRELEVLLENSKQHISDLEVKNSDLEFSSETIKQQASTLEAKNSELYDLYQDSKQQAVNLEAKNTELEILYEASKQQSISLEAKVTELEVLYGASKQQILNMEVNSTELEAFCEASKQKSIDLEAKNNELVRKLSEYQSRIGEMQHQLYHIQKNSEEMAASIICQVDILEKEMGEKASVLEREWNSTINEIIETVGKLDASIGRLSTTPRPSGGSNGLDVGCHLAASVNAATNLIEDLKQKLDAAYKNHEAILSSYNELNGKFSDVSVKNEFAISLLGRVFAEVKKLINDSYGYVQKSEMNLEDDRSLDLLEPQNYEALIENLGKLLDEKLRLESENNELKSELMQRAQDIEELKGRCLDTEAILKLVGDAEGVIRLGDMEMDPHRPVASRLESVLHFLKHKYIEASDYVSLSRENFESKMVELSELKEKIQQLSSLNSQYEDEIHSLKASLSMLEEAREAFHSELRAKAAELEQSELRVSSAREKLSIAVAKGKGLVVQRDNLKQSLADTSSELEKCLQELHLKDAQLRDVEMKLKAYMEAGERVEALESELSYIRNSATGLRESFLLKDSILQRIEEILEDLELPEHFHSRDIIEKIEWLARSVAGNTLPLTDWDQKSSVGGGSYSDTGFVVMDSWKDDVHSSLNIGDDLRRKYEELQSKFYGLAEQNEMLEQSLMERNNLVRRWEEVLDRIDMPLQLRSMEPEDRIGWLGSALAEAHHDLDSLRRKIDEFESYCRSLTADLEGSQEKISELQATFQSAVHERNHLSECLENITRENNEISEKATQYELEKVDLQNEVSGLQEKLAQNLEHEEYIEGEIRKLQVLVSDALQDHGTETVISGSSSIEHLDGLLRKLVEIYVPFLRKPMVTDAVKELVKEEANVVLYEQKSEEALNLKEQDPQGLQQELENALDNLAREKEEMRKVMEKHQSLVLEVEQMVRQRDDLQERRNQEEQKSASVREKLNVAVRKGKGLLQQRDSLKQTIEEMSMEIEHLKNELSVRENSLAQYEQKLRDFSIYSGKVETLESENLFLRGHLEETQQHLQENGQTLSRLLNMLHAIDVDGQFEINDPVQKLEVIGKLCHDLHAAVDSSEHEARKSKRAADLLLAELNEVQERNDGLQEELAKAEIAVTELTKERNAAEAARIEALSDLQQVRAVNSKEKKNQFAEVKELKDRIDQLRKECVGVSKMLADALSKDVELLNNIEAGMRSLFKQMECGSGLPAKITSDGIISSNLIREVKFPVSGSLSETHKQEYFNDGVVIEPINRMSRGLQECVREIDSQKEKLYGHSVSFNQQVKSVSRVLETVYQEINSHRESCESMKGDITNLELMKKEKDNEIIVMCRKVGMLYEACTNSIVEIEKRKAQLAGNGLTCDMHSIGREMNFKIPKHDEGRDPVDGWAHNLTEDCVKNLAENLLLAVKDSASVQADMIESSLKDLKATVLSLQKELQEKDIQNNRICAELVGQIKEAEAAAKNYSLDLEFAKAQVNDLEKHVEAVERERNLLDLRVKELQDGETTKIELQGKIKSLTEALTAKDQEIETLMQALDEEEAQMERLTRKIEGLERVVEQKNMDLESLQSSRGKAMTKLSITVSKFEELHHLSESLLSEVENLQSQLHGRDTEISFLRQEVTRCMNDALAASQESNKRDSNEIHELLTWLDMMISRVAVRDVNLNDKKCHPVNEYQEILERHLTSIISELEDLRAMAQSRDSLLQTERSRVEDLLHRKEVLENSLHEREYQLALLQGVGDSGQETSTASTEILEVEPMINKRIAAGTSMAPHVRGLRKVNNDQVAIGIDMDPGNNKLEDEEDDKVHGFKSLTTSRIVPRFTRPVTDMIDGLWVSCDRALMRQPDLRLGIIFYWAVLHTLLASFVF